MSSAGACATAWCVPAPRRPRCSPNGRSPAACVAGLLADDRERAFTWFRRAVLVSLLITQVALLRIEEWVGYAGLALDVVLLGLVAAELDVLREREHGGADGAGDGGTRGTGGTGDGAPARVR